jgi:hypothetical protein
VADLNPIGGRKMKLLTIAVLVLCAAGSMRGESFVADHYCDGVAEILQKKIPEFAVDRLFEAKRGSAEWRYAFWTKAEKTWVEEVRITVRQKAAHTSDVVVEVFRVEGGLVKTTSKPQALAEADWTAKIRELLKK